MLDPSPIAPAWLTAPLGAIGLVVVGGHLLMLVHSSMDPRRRRLRLAMTGLLMLATPLMVYGASVTSPRDPRTFVLTWVLVAALMVMVLVLAMMDMAHTLVVQRAESRALRRTLAAPRAGEQEGAPAREVPGGADGGAA